MVVGGYALLGFLVPLIFLPTLFNQVIGNGILVIPLRQPFLPLEGCLEIDALSLFMVAVFLLIGLMASMHSLRYVERDTGVFGYHTLLLSLTAGLVGVSFAGDFFTFFLFWEVMCVSSYALVAFRQGEPDAVAAGYKYLIMSAAGSMTLLFAISLLYGMTGTLNFAFLSEGLSQIDGGSWMHLALAMILVGFGIQMGMVPLHAWLPEAHSAAPSPISAMLSGAMVKIGVFGLIRLLFLLFPQAQGLWRMALAVLSALTMFTGNLMALLQDDVKRILAFSTIANVGYILFGLASGSLPGWTGSLFHLLNHAICKALLFLCAGSFIHQTGARSLTALAGIGRRMPITGALFTVGSLAILGVPPLNAFWSELMIVVEGLESGLLFVSTAMIVNIILSAFYFFRMIQVIMLQETTSTSLKARKAPFSMLIPTLALAFYTIIIGLYPAVFRAMAEAAANAALNVQAYVAAVLG
jgi:multicomponent Na+:H+ antiporter subunit D